MIITQITDKEHLANIKKNPVHFLKQSSLDFFISTSSSSIALSQKLLPFLNNEVFVQQFKDIVEYRTMDYYSRRYREAYRGLMSKYRLEGQDDALKTVTNQCELWTENVADSEDVKIPVSYSINDEYGNLKVAEQTLRYGE